MDGVTILAVEQTYTVIEAIILCSSVVVAAILGTIAFAMLDESLPVSCVFFLVATVLIIVAIRTPQSETQYKVVIDDSVTYQEFLARYDVISQKGQIITVIEKERVDEQGVLDR